MNRFVSVNRVLPVIGATVLGLSLVFGLASIAKANLDNFDDGINSENSMFNSKFSVNDFYRNQNSIIRVIEQDENSLLLDLETPYPQIIQETSQTGICQTLTVEGYAATTRPGWPQIPVKGALVGIPIYSTPSISVVDYKEVTLTGKYTICPVVSPITNLDKDGQFIVDSYQRIVNRQAYNQNGYAPEELVGLSSTGFVRSQRVAQLYFQPFQYNPVTGAVRYYPLIRIRLNYNSFNGTMDSQGIFDEDPGFEQLLKDSLLNYYQARSWRMIPITNPIQTSDIVEEAFPNYKLLVNQSGIYQVTYADLLAAGVPVDTLHSIDPLTIKITNQGQEIAILVSGEQDGKFDPGDKIIFYGEGLDSVFTKTNIYWLSWGNSIGLRMISVDGTPGGTATVPSNFNSNKHMEENHNYLTANPSGPNNDRWYWGFVYASGSPSSANYSTNIEHLASTIISPTVTGLLKGYSATPYHHTIIKLNNQIIHDSTNWEAQAEYSFNVEIPASYLVEGVNTITVECPLDRGITNELLFINYFDINYPSPFIAINDKLQFSYAQSGKWEFQAAGFSSEDITIFDITNPVSPMLVTGARNTLVGSTYTVSFEQNLNFEKAYLALTNSQWLRPEAIILDVPSNLHSPTNSADYLLITHADFITEAQRLSDYRAAQGLRSSVIDVQDIYDEFSSGIYTPEAIKDFLSYSYHNWAPPAPAYVVLFGDGNYDFKDNFGYGEINYIPPYLADVDPWIGETAADNRFVTVSGDDLLPDMHLGRLPVGNATQAHQLVDKIMQYESLASVTDWNKKILFVADNADSAGDFASISDSVADNYLSSPYFSEKVYYLVTHPSNIAVRSAIVQAINDGRIVVNYVGHASAYYWAYEQLFRSEDIGALTNHESYPLMVPMTCMDGYFIRPSSPTFDASSLGESIVASTPNGAIASWSPTGFGVASGHDFLNKGLFEALFTEDVIQLGPATTLAKLYLAANSTLHNDLLDTYILFGDPATQLNVPPAEVSISKTVSPQGILDPGDQITYTLTFTNAGIATAHHVVITDQLPTMLLNPVVTSSGVSITKRPGTSYVWDVEDIAPGETGVITISATIDPNYYGSIANTASISTTARELDTQNNSTAPVTTLVQQPTSTLLGGFTATSYPGAILVQWETTSEINLTGFNLYRANSPGGMLLKVNPEAIVPETPGSGLGNSYDFYDTGIVSGQTYYYWIELTTDRDTYINGPIDAFADYYVHVPLLQH